MTLTSVTTYTEQGTGSNGPEVALTVVALAGVTGRVPSGVTVSADLAPAGRSLVITPNVARSLGVRLFEAASAAEKKLLRSDWP